MTPKRNVSILKQSANLKANNPYSITTHPTDNIFAILCLCVFSGDPGCGRYAHLLATRRLWLFTSYTIFFLLVEFPFSLC
jgi:hypothetical protein